jgi:hypothetical protein
MASFGNPTHKIKNFRMCMTHFRTQNSQSFMFVIHNALPNKKKKQNNNKMFTYKISSFFLG